MAIQPFQIVNEDGTLNQQEYERCIQFLNDWISGTVHVAGQVTWDNPLEFNFDKYENYSSFEIILDMLYNSEATNRLLTPDMWTILRKYFRGAVSGLSRTIYPMLTALCISNRFLDGPGNYFDLCDANQTAIKLYPEHCPFVDNDEKTTLSIVINNQGGFGFPENFLNPEFLDIDYIDWYDQPQKKWDNEPPQIYYNTYFHSTGNYDPQFPETFGYVFSLFAPTSSCYNQTPAYFEWGYCPDDVMFTHGMSNQYDPDLGIIYYPTQYNIAGAGDLDWYGKQCVGIPLTSVATIRTNHLLIGNHFLDPRFANQTYHGVHSMCLNNVRDFFSYYLNIESNGGA